MLSALLKQQALAVSDDAAAQFSAGYLYGVTAQDKRDYILGCFANDATLNEMLDQFHDDVVRQDWEACKKDGDASKPLFETAMAACDELSSLGEAL